MKKIEKQKQHWQTILEQVQDIYDENPEPSIKNIRLIIFVILGIVFPVGALFFAMN